MEFTFDESVHLIDTYTDKMMQDMKRLTVTMTN